MTAFEKMPTMFPTVTCTVVEDDEIEGDIPARCIPDFEGHYTIEVKKIEPSKIICFGTPFPEMGGNIIAVDYAESRKAVS